MNPDELPTARAPTIHPGAWVAPNAVVVGDVTLAEGASVWYGCVMRGDIAPIRIGARTNVQDLTMVHVDTDRPCEIGADVGIGHRAIIHGCTIGDGCLIGMGAILLSHAVIGEGSVIAAGAVVTEGAEIPPRSLVIGVPGRVVRKVDDELRRRTARTVDHYLALSAAHRDGRFTGAAG